MHALLSRPEAEARRTAERLASFGHDAVVAPVLSISRTEAKLPADPGYGLIATSANARIAFAEGVPEGWLDLPLYVVGERTAEPFRALGFGRIHVAQGDAASLAGLILDAAPAGARLLYLAGADRKPALETALAEAGVELAVAEIYRAEAAQALPEAAAQALRDGALDAALHFSRRSAEILFALADHERLGAPLRALRHLCLSDDVARAVRRAGAAQVEVAGAPNEASLLALLDTPADAMAATLERTGCEGSEAAAIRDREPPPGRAGPAERSIMTADTDKERSARKRSSGPQREPQVLDLPPDAVTEATPEQQAAAAAETPVAETDASPAPEASAALGEGAPPAEAEPAETEPPPPPPAEPPPYRRPPSPSYGVPIAAGLLGGVVGAAVIALAATLWGGLGDINDRLTGLESSVGEKATRRTVEAVDKRVAADEGAVQGLRGDLDALAKRVPADPASALAQLSERLEKLETGVGALESRPAPAAPSSPPPPPAPAIGARETAILSVAWLVRDDLQRSLPYARELEALKAAKADPAAIAALEPFAAKGAPTVAALQAQFAPLAEKIANPPPPPVQGGWWERMQARVGGLYKVRPLGEASGDTPAAIAARADAALKRGALAEAVNELGKLPDSDKASIKSFLDLAQARLAAGRAADDLVTKSADQVLAATQSGGAVR